MRANQGAGLDMADEACYAAVKTHKRWSNKIYNFELTTTKILNQVKSKYQVDSQRTRFTFIAELTWSNLGLIKDFKK